MASILIGQWFGRVASDHVLKGFRRTHRTVADGHGDGQQLLHGALSVRFPNRNKARLNANAGGQVGQSGIHNGCGRFNQNLWVSDALAAPCVELLSEPGSLRPQFQSTAPSVRQDMIWASERACSARPYGSSTHSGDEAAELWQDMSLTRNIWPITKKVFDDWNAHEAPRLGASLAFYTILSLSPLLVLAVAIAGLFFGRSVAIQHLSAEVQALIGSAGAQALSTTLNSAQKSPSRGVLATAVSLLVVLFSASGVCGELRSALNKIWEVDPDNGSGLWSMVRERLFSFGMVLAIAFLLLASLVLSTVLAAASGFLGSVVPMPHLLAAIIDLIISLIGITAVFALMFRYVPAIKIPWGPALHGGLLTAVLFTLGKYAIGAYLAKAAVGSAYGAAGSVVVVIVWMYYTAQIVFFGAEFTHVISSQPALLRGADARRSDRDTHLRSVSQGPQTRTT